MLTFPDIIFSQICEFMINNCVWFGLGAFAFVFISKGAEWLWSQSGKGDKRNPLLYLLMALVNTTFVILAASFFLTVVAGFLSGLIPHPESPYQAPWPQ